MNTSFEKKEPTKPIFIQSHNKENIKRERSLSYPTPPDEKWLDKIKLIKHPQISI